MPSLGIIITFQTITLLITALFLVNISANAQEPRIYKFTSVDGVISFSDIEPANIDFEQVKVGCYACKVDSVVNWHQSALYLTQYRDSILTAAKHYHVEPAFIRAIIHAESHFDVDAISKQGAQGLMQLMPKTAKSLGVNNAFSAAQNINGGVKHLSSLLLKYNGNNRLVAAAYNAGEGAVKKYAGIPPFTETKVYVERVAILHQRYKKALKL